MQDATLLVYNTLYSNAELRALLNSKTIGKKQEWTCIYNSVVAPYTDEYPRITMFEVLNDDEVFADNVAQFSDVNVRVDLWLDNDTDVFEIVDKIKKVLKGTEDVCGVKIRSTMYEADTKVTHKPIDVYLFLSQEEEGE